MGLPQLLVLLLAAAHSSVVLADTSIDRTIEIADDAVEPTHQRALHGWFGGGKATPSVSVGGDFALRRAPEVGTISGES